MKYQSLGTRSAVGTATAVQTGTSPFIQKNGAVAVFTPSPDFAGAAKLQGSDDGTTYSDISGAAITDATPLFVNVTSLPKYVRLNCTARTAGSVTAGLLG